MRPQPQRSDPTLRPHHAETLPSGSAPAAGLAGGTAPGGSWRARWRKHLAASMLGVAVVIAPAWPTAAQERASRRPPFERALSWRDFIRMRLSPWLLLQQTRQPADEFQADEFEADNRS